MWSQSSHPVQSNLWMDPIQVQLWAYHWANGATIAAVTSLFQQLRWLSSCHFLQQFRLYVFLHISDLWLYRTISFPGLPNFRHRYHVLVASWWRVKSSSGSTPLFLPSQAFPNCTPLVWLCWLFWGIQNCRLMTILCGVVIWLVGF